MTLKLVDVRGRSCPEPVVLTRKALEQSPQGVHVLLDAAVSRDNMRRFAESRGYNTKVQNQGQDFLVIISR